MLTIHKDSHLDHDLQPLHVDWIKAHFADREGFFIETVELPDALADVPCGLYGPIMGDAPVTDSEVAMMQRGNRQYTSRMVDRPMRQVRSVTVIAGPHKGTCTTCAGQTSEDFKNGGLMPRSAEWICPTCQGTNSVDYSCVLYTAFGGPCAPQETNDPGCKDLVKSQIFWKDHALAK